MDSAAAAVDDASRDLDDIFSLLRPAAKRQRVAHQPSIAVPSLLGPRASLASPAPDVDHDNADEGTLCDAVGPLSAPQDAALDPLIAAMFRASRPEALRARLQRSVNLAIAVPRKRVQASRAEMSGLLSALRVRTRVPPVSAARARVAAHAAVGAGVVAIDAGDRHPSPGAPAERTAAHVAGGGAGSGRARRRAVRAALARPSPLPSSDLRRLHAAWCAYAQRAACAAALATSAARSGGSGGGGGAHRSGSKETPRASPPPGGVSASGAPPTPQAWHALVPKLDWHFAAVTVSRAVDGRLVGLRGYVARTAAAAHIVLACVGGDGRGGGAAAESAVPPLVVVPRAGTWFAVWWPSVLVAADSDADCSRGAAAGRAAPPRWPWHAHGSTALEVSGDVVR